MEVNEENSFASLDTYMELEFPWGQWNCIPNYVQIHYQDIVCTGQACLCSGTGARTFC